MIALVLGAQVLPLALLTWLALHPAPSLAGYLVQLAGLGAALLALALVAQWAVLLWWLVCSPGAVRPAATMRRPCA